MNKNLQLTFLCNFFHSFFFVCGYFLGCLLLTFDLDFHHAFLIYFLAFIRNLDKSYRIERSYVLNQGVFLLEKIRVNELIGLTSFNNSNAIETVSSCSNSFSGVLHHNCGINTNTNTTTTMSSPMSPISPVSPMYPVSPLSPTFSNFNTNDDLMPTVISDDFRIDDVILEEIHDLLNQKKELKKILKEGTNYLNLLDLGVEFDEEKKSQSQLEDITHQDQSTPMILSERQIFNSTKLGFNAGKDIIHIVEHESESLHHINLDDPDPALPHHQHQNKTCSKVSLMVDNLEEENAMSISTTSSKIKTGLHNSFNSKNNINMPFTKQQKKDIKSGISKISARIEKLHLELNQFYLIMYQQTFRLFADIFEERVERIEDWKDTYFVDFDLDIVSFFPELKANCLESFVQFLKLSEARKFSISTYRSNTSNSDHTLEKDCSVNPNLLSLYDRISPEMPDFKSKHSLMKLITPDNSMEDLLYEDETKTSCDKSLLRACETDLTVLDVDSEYKNVNDEKEEEIDDLSVCSNHSALKTETNTSDNIEIVSDSDDQIIIEDIYENIHELIEKLDEMKRKIIDRNSITFNEELSRFLLLHIQVNTLRFVCQRSIELEKVENLFEIERNYMVLEEEMFLFFDKLQTGDQLDFKNISNPNICSHELYCLKHSNNIKKLSKYLLLFINHCVEALQRNTIFIDENFSNPDEVLGLKYLDNYHDLEFLSIFDISGQNKGIVDNHFGFSDDEWIAFGIEDNFPLKQMILLCQYHNLIDLLSSVVVKYHKTTGVILLAYYTKSDINYIFLDTYIPTLNEKPLFSSCSTSLLMPILEKLLAKLSNGYMNLFPLTLQFNALVRTLLGTRMEIIDHKDIRFGDEKKKNCQFKKIESFINISVNSFVISVASPLKTSSLRIPSHVDFTIGCIIDTIICGIRYRLLYLLPLENKDSVFKKLEKFQGKFAKDSIFWIKPLKTKVEKVLQKFEMNGRINEKINCTEGIWLTDYEYFDHFEKSFCYFLTCKSLKYSQVVLLNGQVDIFDFNMMKTPISANNVVSLKVVPLTMNKYDFDKIIFHFEFIQSKENVNVIFVEFYLVNCSNQMILLKKPALFNDRFIYERLMLDSKLFVGNCHLKIVFGFEKSKTVSSRILANFYCEGGNLSFM
eukprot:TRINITY_DN9450_c0_g1_i1.p1 TRINITY_DN9450_c0_g1~~TRINITY_DN9450_c0_g1_i1.p1  ORF type:complete len:1145 (+),score=304.69 TRINITY_DN9450_c0_g1_i1:93-3527(+)